MKKSLSQKTLMLILALGAALATPVAVFLLVHFSFLLSPEEKSLLGFAPAQLSLTPRRWQETSVSSPVFGNASSAVAARLTEGTGKNRQKAEQDLGALPRLSFVLYQGDPARDSAILDGNLVKQGSRLQGWQVQRIEQRRVQLAGKKGTTWLSMEN